MKTSILGPFASFAAFIAHEIHHLIIMSKNIYSFGSGEIKHKVKTKGVKVKIEGVALPYIKPLYGKALEIIFYHKTPITRQQLAFIYDLCNIKPCPKRLKVGRNFKKEEVQEFFGLSNNKNGYQYYFNDNLELNKRVEEVWMITHQCIQIPNMHLINKAEARGIMCEKKGQAINWAVFCEWTIKKQLRKIQLFEVGKRDKVGGHLGEETKFDEKTMVTKL
jgi:hypothetical protein